MTTLTLAPKKAPLAEVPQAPASVLYDFSSLYIGQELWLRDRLIRVRSIYAPTNKARWQHVVEAEDLLDGSLVSLETGVAVIPATMPEARPERAWIKYQNNEVWVIYLYRHGQVMRYQGGTYQLLDTRVAQKLPAIPRGALVVAGHFLAPLLTLIGKSNHKPYLSGEEMSPEWHEQHETLSRLFNTIAERSFWYYKQPHAEEGE